MVVRSERRVGPSAVERSAASTTAAMAGAAETLQSHLEFVLEGRAGALSGEQRRLLDVALRYGERLVRLVEDMRTVALAESGELEMTWSRFDVDEVARWAVEQVWPVARVEGKPIDFRCDASVPIDGDRKRVARAVLGLLSDVLEAVEPGTAVSVRVGETGIRIDYGSDELPPESSLALAEAIAGVHGGGLTVASEGGGVSLVLRFAAKPVPVSAAA
jgi:two-component system sensor histidine kinase AdeS